jgi:hypothetical protein
MYDYYQRSYEARERIKQREHEAQSERIIRHARARRQRRRAQLASALGHLIPARQRARLRIEA